MNYELIQPPPLLNGIIRYCWQVNNEMESVHPSMLQVVADGCPGLLYAQRGDVYRQGERLPQIILYGQSVEPVQLAIAGGSIIVGICFYPDALKVLYGLNAFELTDTCMDMNELAEVRNAHLPERLWQPLSNNPIDVLLTFISTNLKCNDPVTDPVITQALDTIIGAGGNVILKTLQDSLRISERSLERRFKQSVGISPKLFARICRFQAALNQVKNGRFEKLSDIAFDNGYADHSHFTRTFKEFTGILPEQYQYKTNLLTKNFPQLITG